MNFHDGFVQESYGNKDVDRSAGQHNGDSVTPKRTAQQYSQLLALLGSHDSDSTMNLVRDGGSSATNSGGAFLAGSGLCFLSTSSSHQWIIDSGASDHMTPNLDLFTSYQTLPHNSYITMPDGQKAPIKHIGNVLLNDKILLHNVLHVPQFQFNLLSVQKLASQFTSSLTFTSSHCLLRDLSLRESLVLGKAHAGLYLVNHNFQSSSCSNKQLLKSDSDVSIPSCALSLSEIWDCRLGHMPFEKLKFVVLAVSDASHTPICHVCPLSRMHRNPFPHSSITTTSFFK